ncbi:MAG: permease [Castellaniella sp.]|uniref:permease n=1 Tax=Castellaniella sp. TaxID=1955812 RepID=UPI003C7069DE
MNPASSQHHRYPLWGFCLFALIALVGLYYVKWSPYYDRVFIAEQTGSIGNSILNGSDGMVPAPSLQAALDYAVAYGKAIWKAMMLGLLLGSGLQALLPSPWIQRWLGGFGAGSVLTGSLLSIPSMMCTCCSAPVVNGLRDCRAAPGSTIAYWLGNTMLNPATLVFMGFVLGWHWAGLRLVAGLAMVLGLGWLVNRLNRGDALADVSDLPTAAMPDQASLGAGSILRRWVQSFTGMALRLLPEYLILVLLLGAVRAWLFPVLDMSIDNSLLWIAGAAIVGLLFVIPTAGEVPIVQTMLALGVATGPAAALLVTLPPVSLPSLAMVAKSFRRRDLTVIILGIAILGMLTGGAAITLGF